MREERTSVGDTFYWTNWKAEIDLDKFFFYEMSFSLGLRKKISTANRKKN